LGSSLIFIEYFMELSLTLKLEKSTSVEVVVRKTTLLGMMQAVNVCA